MRGFGYMYGPSQFSRRMDTVGGRFDRALERIATVDPYAAPRRIGLALMATGLVEPEPEPPPDDTDVSTTRSPVWPPATDDPRNAE